MFLDKNDDDVLPGIRKYLDKSAKVTPEQVLKKLKMVERFEDVEKVLEKFGLAPKLAVPLFLFDAKYNLD